MGDLCSSLFQSLARLAFLELLIRHIAEVFGYLYFIKNSVSAQLQSLLTKEIGTETNKIFQSPIFNFFVG